MHTAISRSKFSSGFFIELSSGCEPIWRFCSRVILFNLWCLVDFYYGDERRLDWYALSYKFVVQLIAALCMIASGTFVNNLTVCLVFMIFLSHRVSVDCVSRCLHTEYGKSD
mgnify:CR=1 FL=1